MCRNLYCLSVVLVCALGLVRMANAGDASEARRHWVHECLVVLTSPEADLRASGRDALARLGPTVLPLLIEEMGTLPDGPPWDELMVLARTMDGPWITTLTTFRDLWPPNMKEGLERVLKTARESERAAAKALTGLDPKVAAILASVDPNGSASSRSPEVRRLVALGHDAVPSLLQAVRQCDSAGQSARTLTAAYALGELVVEADAPGLEKLLREGHGAAATPVRSLKPATAARLIAAAIDRDLMDMHVQMTAMQMPGQPAIVKAANSWVERHAGDASPDDLTGAAAVLGEIGDEDSARLVRKIEPGIPASCPSRWQVFAALVRLGDRDAVEELLALYRSQTELRDSLADALRDPFASSVPVSVWPRDTVTGGPSLSGLDPDAFSKWWAGVRDKAVFDRAARAWMVK